MPKPALFAPVFVLFWAVLGAVLAWLVGIFALLLHLMGVAWFFGRVAVAVCWVAVACLLVLGEWGGLPHYWVYDGWFVIGHDCPLSLFINDISCFSSISRLSILRKILMMASAF